jgi:small conductance mechanosensitive channel
VIIPNGSLANGVIVNYTRSKTRRVDLTIGISYKNDYMIATEALLKLATTNPKIHQSPEPFVGVKSYGDNSIELVFRSWCDTEDYWDVFYYLNNNLKKSLDLVNISIPFPQRDVHIYKV